MSNHSRQWPNDCAVLIPSYRSADKLDSFLPILLTSVPAESILVVDDGSRDHTDEVCRRLGVSCTAHECNKGKGAALRLGFQELAMRDITWIATMDADGQHAVNDLPRFISAARRYPDSGLIIGTRSRRLGTMPAMRILSNTMTSAALSLLTRSVVSDSQCGFRFYSKRLLSATTTTCDRFEMESEIILRARFAGFPVRFVEVQTLYCTDQSHISPGADTVRWIRAVVRTLARIRAENRTRR